MPKVDHTYYYPNERTSGNLTFVCHSEEHGDEESPGSEGLGEILRFTQNDTQSFPDGN